MSRIWIGAVCAALLLALGFGALQAGAAKRHSHRNKVVYRSASTTIGAEPNVQFVTAFCPTGYKAVGGGGDAVGISLSNGTEINSSSYTTWWIANGPPPRRSNRPLGLRARPCRLGSPGRVVGAQSEHWPLGTNSGSVQPLDQHRLSLTAGDAHGLEADRLIVGL
jgi:hypothetical protein